MKEGIFFTLMVRILEQLYDSQTSGTGKEEEKVGNVEVNDKK